MAVAPNQDQSLLSLIARSWQINAQIADVCFDFDNRSVAFLTGNGHVRLAPVADPDPVSKRARMQADAGRITISPRTEPAKPLTDVSAPDGLFVIVRPHPQGGFVGATSKGQLAHLSSDGSQENLGDDPLGEPVALATSAQGKRIAVLLENELCVFSAQGAVIARTTLERPSQDVDFSPDGSRIAVCDEGGVTIYRIVEPSLQEDRRLVHPGRHIRVAWSPTGRFVAAARDGSGLCTWRLRDGAALLMSDFPSESHLFNWGPEDRFLAASGAYRVICWPLGDSDFDNDNSLPMETGMMGVVLVTATAAQSKRNLVAAGYANGIVVVGQAGAPDELLVRGADGDAVTCASWTDDGLGLAFGTADGFAAMVTFPDFMFK